MRKNITDHNRRRRIFATKQATASTKDVTEIRFGGGIEATEIVTKGEKQFAKVSGWLVQYDKVDSHKQHFKSETDFGRNRDEAFTMPLMIEHGKFRKFGKKSYGEVTCSFKDEGIYAEGLIDLSLPNAAQVQTFVKNGQMGWSSGAGSHTVDVDDEGFIKSWFICEGSLTRKPAEKSNVAYAKSVDDLPDWDEDETAIKGLSAWSVSELLSGLAYFVTYPAQLLNLENTASLIEDAAQFVRDGKLGYDFYEELRGLFAKSNIPFEVFERIVENAQTFKSTPVQLIQPNVDNSAEISNLKAQIATLESEKTVLEQKLESESALKADAESQLNFLLEIKK
jgi:hypothetical protein